MTAGRYDLVNTRSQQSVIRFSYPGNLVPENGLFQLDLLPGASFSFTFAPGTSSTAILDHARFDGHQGSLTMGDALGAAAPGTYRIVEMAESDEGPGPATHLEGRRVRRPGTPAVYLVLEGLRRLIPDPATHHNLFDAWEAILDTEETSGIPEGSALSSGASLVHIGSMGICIADCTTGPNVYLSSNGQLRFITSPAVFNRYAFSWGKIGTYLGPFTEGHPIT